MILTAQPGFLQLLSPDWLESTLALMFGHSITPRMLLGQGPVLAPEFCHNSALHAVSVQAHPFGYMCGDPINVCAFLGSEYAGTSSQGSPVSILASGKSFPLPILFVYGSTKRTFDFGSPR